MTPDPGPGRDRASGLAPPDPGSDPGRGPERSPERDAAILALLPRVGAEGWTVRALREAAGPDADLLFPGGPADLVEAYCDLADRWMEEDAARAGLAGLSLTGRVRAVVALRFRRNRPYKDAVRRALGVLAWPGRAGLAARCTARTVDSIWHAAGDRSADAGWYTKRAILAGIYGVTLLRWLREDDPGENDQGDEESGDADTLAFLDRRLAGVAALGRLRRQASAVVANSL